MNAEARHERTERATASSHRGRLLSEPLWISLVLAVQLHLLRPQRHAAVAVEVQAVVSADVSPLLLQLSILSLQELRQTWLGPLGPGGSDRETNLTYTQLQIFTLLLDITYIDTLFNEYTVT